MFAHANGDHGIDGGIEVDLVAVFHVAHPLHTFRLQHVDDLFDALGDGFVLDQNLVDKLRVTLGLMPFVDRGPVRAVQLHLIVPLLIVVGFRYRLFAPHVIETDRGDAGIFVGHEFSGADPDFLGVITGQLTIHFMGHLNSRHIFAYLALARGDILYAILPGEFVEIPQQAIVITIGNAQRFEDAQAGYVPAHREYVEQFQPHVPGELGIGLVGLDIGVEAFGQRVEFGIISLDGVVEQHQRHSLQQGDSGVLWCICIVDVEQRTPEFFQAGKILHGTILDPCIFHEADEKHLRRAELFGGEWLVGIHQVCALVDDHGAVKLVSLHIVNAIHCIGQVYYAKFQIGFEAFVIGGAGTQEEITPPQGTQIEIHLALIIDK